MRALQHRFVRGALACLGLLLATTLAVTPIQGHAQEDPTEYPLAGLAGVIDEVVGQIEAVPCFPLPCSIPIPTVPARPDVTGEVVALAIGGINPGATVTPGNPAPLLALAGYCQPALDQFLGNTEYLGPLLDYGVCLESNGATRALQALPAVSQNVKYILGSCLLTTKTNFRASSNLTRFSGTTDCTTGFGFTPQVSGGANLLDFLDGEVIAGGVGFSGSRIGVSNGSKTGRIGKARTAKVKFTTGIVPGPHAYCPSGAVCDISWVVLPNKNPNTGSRLTCTENGDNLNCEMDSIPVVDEAIAVQ